MKQTKCVGLSQCDFAAWRIDFSLSVQPTIMLFFSVYFDLIECTQRFEIYSSERQIALSSLDSFEIFCVTNFVRPSRDFDRGTFLRENLFLLS